MSVQTLPRSTAGRARRVQVVDHTYPIADPVGCTDIDERADAAFEERSEVVFRAEVKTVGVETSVEFEVDETVVCVTGVYAELGLNRWVVQVG